MAAWVSECQRVHVRGSVGVYVCVNGRCYRGLIVYLCMCIWVLQYVSVGVCQFVYECDDLRMCVRKCQGRLDCDRVCQRWTGCDSRCQQMSVCVSGFQLCQCLGLSTVVALCGCLYMCCHGCVCMRVSVEVDGQYMSGCQCVRSWLWYV